MLFAFCIGDFWEWPDDFQDSHARVERAAPSLSTCSCIGSRNTNCLSIQRVLKDYSVMPLPEQISPEQIAAFRAMGGPRRLRLAEQLYWSARKMKTAGVRSQHPDWSPERVREEVRRLFTHART